MTSPACDLSLPRHKHVPTCCVTGAYAADHSLAPALWALGGLVVAAPTLTMAADAVAHCGQHAQRVTHTLRLMGSPDVLTRQQGLLRAGSVALGAACLAAGCAIASPYPRVRAAACGFLSAVEIPLAAVAATQPGAATGPILARSLPRSVALAASAVMTLHLARRAR